LQKDGESRAGSFRRKKLLYICQYFNTPKEGGLLRPWEVSKYFLSHGYDVTVVAAAPHHMSGVVDRRFHKRLFWSQTIEGIEVIKTFSFTNYRGNLLRRLLYYTIYPALAFVAAMRVRKPSLIITSTPPFFLLISGFLATKLKGKEFIAEVRDAWLEYVLARKLVPKLLGPTLKLLQTFMFKEAKNIISVTPGIKKIVDDYTKEPMKNLLVMNGYEVDVNEWTKESETKAETVIKKYDLGGKFAVLYTGTLGMARDTDIFGRTAKYLKDYKDIFFVFIGEGEKKAPLMEYCERNGLKNCVFVPLQPRDMMPVFMHISHVGINSIRRNECLESSLSNKVFEYLGNGLPVVWAGEGDTSEFLEKCGGGFVVEPENEREMGEAILRLYRSRDLRHQMAERGRDYVLRNLTRQKVMRNIDPILQHDL